MSTEILIQADDHSIYCPHCDEEQPTITISRLYQLSELICDGCYESYSLTLTVEPA